VDDALRLSLLPNGTYQTDPDAYGPMTAAVNQVEEKDAAGNVIGQRTVITLMGRGRAKVRVNGSQEIVEGRLPRVQFSPQPRFKVDYNTGETLATMDGKTLLYAQAVKAYTQQFKERPKHVGQVVDFLVNFAARYRVIQIGLPSKENPEPDGEPRNWCVGISAAR
jgi:hypothetical protein